MTHPIAPHYADLECSSSSAAKYKRKKKPQIKTEPEYPSIDQHLQNKDFFCLILLFRVSASISLSAKTPPARFRPSRPGSTSSKMATTLIPSLFNLVSVDPVE